MIAEIRYAFGILSVCVRVQLKRACNLKTLEEAVQLYAIAHRKESPVANPRSQM